MKKLTLLSLVFVLMQTIGAMAQKIVSVSQFPAMKPDYSDIQAAIDAVEAGTKIYVYNGVYNGFTVNKQLTIIGPGYFLEENPQNHAQAMSVLIKGDANIILNSSANGSVVQGLNIKTKVNIENTSNITLKNCLINSDYPAQYLNIVVTGSSDIYIKGNYISQGLYNTHCIDVSTSNNVNILNNYISQSYNYCAVSIQNQFSSYLSHNVIYGPIQCENTIISNNIWRGRARSPDYGYYGVYLDNSFSNCTTRNNISIDNTTFGLSGGNKYVEDFSTVFLSPSGSSDGQWQLKEGSPAKGAGEGGIDCGMYGGVEPYKLSGISDIPVIYEFSAPLKTGELDGLQVKLKVRTN